MQSLHDKCVPLESKSTETWGSPWTALKITELLGTLGIVEDYAYEVRSYSDCGRPLPVQFSA